MFAYIDKMQLCCKHGDVIKFFLASSYEFDGMFLSQNISYIDV